MRALILLLLMVSAMVAATDVPAPAPAEAPKPAPKPWEPSKGTSNWFMPMHQDHKRKSSAAAKAGVDVVFFGDSITQFWERHPAIWKEMVGTQRAVNFGIGGDRTQEMLWRIEDGLFAGLSPKVIVLMAGANNWRDKADETARGIAAVVAALRTACPASRVLLLGTLPSQEKHNPYRDHIARINRDLAKLDDGDRVRFLDFGAKLINPDGTISKAVQYDFLHLDAEGYRIWTRETAPLLNAMLTQGTPK